MCAKTAGDGLKLPNTHKASTKWRWNFGFTWMLLAVILFALSVLCLSGLNKLTLTIVVKLSLDLTRCMCWAQSTYSANHLKNLFFINTFKMMIFYVAFMIQFKEFYFARMWYPNISIISSDFLCLKTQCSSLVHLVTLSTF